MLICKRQQKTTHSLSVVHIQIFIEKVLIKLFLCDFDIVYELGHVECVAQKQFTGNIKRTDQYFSDRPTFRFD